MGLCRAGQLRARVEALLDWRKTIQAFRTEIGYAARPLGELIARTGDSRFCREALEDREFYRDPKSAFIRAGERTLREQADLDLYRGFAKGLGESDIQGQLEHLELYAGLLEQNLTQAKEAKDTKSRLYVCLGLFCGIALCLVLL